MQHIHDFIENKISYLFEKVIWTKSWKKRA